ncbi:M67 family metallopeptidase [Acidobacteriia bacterium AH_259_A11_L15]|nr:M67 family metallopeptidase [Acidobacteriia bacterium AH_259_A11_L15]
MALRITEALLDEIRRHGARAYPNECCGAMLGVVNGDTKEVRELLSLDNRREGEAARTRFLITADDYRLAEKTAREKELEILGFYHSHPDHPARPSEFDREHAWPWYSYIVVRVARRKDGQAGGEPQEATNWVLAEDRSRFLPEEMRGSAATP